MKRIYSIAAACCVSLSVLAQTDVQPFRPGVTVEGITYCLPRTALRLVFTATRTDYQPGALQPYAKRYMAIDDVAAEAATTWTLDKVDVQPYGVPDSTRFFSIALKGKTIAPQVTLTEDGRLLAVHTSAQEEALPPVPRSVEGKSDINPRDFMTRDMLSAGSKAKQAELVAQEIYDIRDSRSALARGEADNTPKDGAQLQLMFDMLQKQEDGLMSLFRGTTVQSTTVKVIDVVPDVEGRSILMRFSSRLGFLDDDDLAGTPVYLTIEPENNIPAPVENEDTKKKKAKVAEKSIRYCIPSQTRVAISTFSKQLADFYTPMAQFGQVEILGSVLFDKDAPTTLLLHPATGGIVKMSGLDKEKE